MKRTLAIVTATLGAAALLGVAVATVVVGRGLYDVGAMTQHTQPVYTLLETALTQSVRLRAAGIQVPAPAGQEALLRGAACYRDHCVQCHGAPGQAPGLVGMSMQPLPGPLLDATRRWHEREIYWITRNGIRMSGMPAWGMRLSDADLWAIVAFIGTLPEMSPAGYARRMDVARSLPCMLPTGDSEAAAGPAATLPDSERARVALRQYACVACHRIPGLTGSDANVGPPLQGLARRALIAGHLPNTPDNMVRWIRSPQALKPGSAMPDLGVTEAHARLMAAYLSRLH